MIPPHANAALGCAMADVLAGYTRPDDPRRPQGCLDEPSTPLVVETREPIPATLGHPVRVDYAHARKGTAPLCLGFEPWAGPRRGKVTERRTAIDFAQVIREVVAEPSPHAEPMVLVMDHLKTHTPASWYAAFAPTEARRLLARLDIHDTPKPGRW